MRSEVIDKLGCGAIDLCVRLIELFAVLEYQHDVREEGFFGGVSELFALIHDGRQIHRCLDDLTVIFKEFSAE